MPDLSTFEQMAAQAAEQAALKYFADHPEVIQQIVNGLVTLVMGKVLAAIQKAATPAAA